MPCPTMNSMATMQRTWCHKKALPLSIIFQSWFPSNLKTMGNLLNSNQEVLPDITLTNSSRYITLL